MPPLRRHAYHSGRSTDFVKARRGVLRSRKSIHVCVPTYLDGRLPRSLVITWPHLAPFSTVPRDPEASTPVVSDLSSLCCARTAGRPSSRFSGRSGEDETALPVDEGLAGRERGGQGAVDLVDQLRGLRPGGGGVPVCHSAASRGIQLTLGHVACKSRSKVASACRASASPAKVERHNFFVITQPGSNKETLGESAFWMA